MTRLTVLKHALDVATAALEIKRRSVRREMGRVISRELHFRQISDTEGVLADVIAPVLVKHVRSIAKELKSLGGEKHLPGQHDQSVHGRWSSGQSGTQRFSGTEEWEKSLPENQKNAVRSWMFSGFSEMREADRTDKADEKLEAFKEAIKSAPLYEQDIHRGIRADVKVKVGDEMSLNAVSSFSTNSAVAKQFAIVDPLSGKTIPASRKLTILSVDKHHGGAKLPMKSVGGTYETEVVVDKNRKFKVSSIEPITIRRGSKKWKGKVVHLTEL